MNIDFQFEMRGQFILALWMAAIVSLGSAVPGALADGLENGDFSHGKSKWVGDGQVVLLNPDGSISPADALRSGSSLSPSSLPSQIPASPAPSDQKPKAAQIIEMKLKAMQFGQFSQKFKTAKGTLGLNMEVVYKGSPDFKLNDKATGFSKGITWGPGTTWYWSEAVSPKVDLCIRLDRRDGHSYRLLAVNPGGNWQTAKFRWENINENEDVALSLLTAPGHGTMWLKSVAIAEK